MGFQGTAGPSPATAELQGKLARHKESLGVKERKSESSGDLG